MTDDTLHLTKLRELHTVAPSQAGRSSFVSAASGLVVAGEHLFVVADDELHLGVFLTNDERPGELVRLLPGELPLEAAARKKAKPDFEVLVRLPGFETFTAGALLAMGSGSTKHRYRSVLMPLNAAGAVSDSPRVFDLQSLHDAVKREVDKVNIEGAVVVRDRLLLFQRGNKGDGINAIVTFDLPAVLSAIVNGDSDARVELVSLREYPLGTIRDVPLSFSDGAALSDGTLIFSAIAEDTNDAYADGPCAGAAIGVIDAQGELQRLMRIREPAKVEGIHAERRGDRVQLLLVTDADDATVPATLFTAELPER